jgi:hypothetical protein|tara:strand:- start:981 stop:1121 length:141 start_codon:yes stop_codon:yes gene_type:complete
MEPPNPVASNPEAGIVSCDCANCAATNTPAKKILFFNNVLAWEYEF